MILFATILSGLALLAASVCLVQLHRERKRSVKRNAALVRYVDKTAFQTARNAMEHTDKGLKEFLGRVEKLEKGVVPDFEQAKAAANAVNDFNKGISNILGFDPMTALAEAQKKERYGDEQ